MNREQLEEKIRLAELTLKEAKKELRDWESLASNNIFVSLEDAEELEGILWNRAKADCEGSYRCGLDEYIQKFMINSVEYVATLEIEYNRYDKTYYYIENSVFSIKPLGVDP